MNKHWGTMKLWEYASAYDAICDNKIEKLELYKELYLPEPKINWEEDEFNKRMYELTAIEELTLLVRINPEMKLFDIIDEFLEEIDDSINGPDYITGDVMEMLCTFGETIDDFKMWLFSKGIVV